MPNEIFLIFTFSLVVLAIWFIRKNYRHFYKGYKIDWSDNKFVFKLLFILLKTIISLTLVIILHNLYHNEHFILMIIFSAIYIALSIFQSEYARVGFQSRVKYIINYIERIFLKRKKQAITIFKSLDNDEFDKYLIVVKILLLIILTFIFLSQISYFILTNLFYVMIISSFFLLTFILNSLIYFGFTSLVLLQYIPNAINFSSINYYIVSVAFIIIFIGLLFDSIFNERICIITGNYMIKHVKFDDNFNFVHRTSKVVIYQHNINRMYYLHFRTVGYVISFESYYDAKEYKSIIRKMIISGKKFLIKNKSSLEKWL
ncbi:hypothetical protein ACAG96_04320 [Candidatus Izemoplasma sp. B36]|uniref:hypothetical protein n=1 Tax=Candidatus Izemoplasma sp. B36 TaxID=3242468 RepID=UPI0035581A7D